MSASRSVMLDRLDQSVAVLQAEDGSEVVVPRTLLPEGAAEGSWLTMALELDPERQQEETRAVAELRERVGSDDDGGDLAL